MENEILNMDDAARLFGVSVKTFIKMLREEKVPARKIGREWRFSRKALIDWLAAGNSQFYSSSEGDTKEFFNSVAQTWESISTGYYNKDIKNIFSSYANLTKTMTVADLGAGDGYLTLEAAKNSKKVFAVDISGGMLGKLKEKAEKKGLKNIVLLEGDAIDIPLNDSSVNIVSASMFLHHIEEPAMAAKEMHRILKPGGKVFLADLKRHSNDEFSLEMHDLWNGFTRSELVKWFENNGFENINITELKDDKLSKEDMGILILTANKG